MKSIYLVVRHAVFDYEDCGISIRAFENEEDASKFFDKEVEREKEMISCSDWIVSSDKKGEFEAYEDGYYTKNHTILEIRILDIE